ncbi:hypothetical protein CRENBAI_018033 [Crenichthys baileyi]|uniref:Uncharacterized protein n=1 Tax=Crenichthys baileyi TaxID=28760 RepID=A0AAV9SBI4_9TELE
MKDSPSLSHRPMTSLCVSRPSNQHPVRLIHHPITFRHLVLKGPPAVFLLACQLSSSAVIMSDYESDDFSGPGHLADAGPPPRPSTLTSRSLRLTPCPVSISAHSTSPKLLLLCCHVSAVCPRWSSPGTQAVPPPPPSLPFRLKPGPGSSLGRSYFLSTPKYHPGCGPKILRGQYINLVFP